MSIIKRFFEGQVRFTVHNLPQSCLNKLRVFRPSNIFIQNNIISFNVPLMYSETIKKMISNFEFEIHQNYNLFRGINFLLNHFSIVVALISALVLYLIADMGIYHVQVQCDDLRLTPAVYERLSELGINNFCWKNQLQQFDLGNELVSNFEQIAHAHVTVSGNTLVIDLVTATNQGLKTKINYYAQYDAVITEIKAYSGKALVTVGDVVKKGDLLVIDAYQDSVVVMGEVAFVNGDHISRLVIWIV